MQIILRGQKVKTQLVSKSLAFIEKDIYRPKFLSVSLNISIAELDSVAVVLMNFGLLLFGIFLLLLVFLSHTEGITSIRPTESNSYFLCSLRFTLVFLNICSKAKTVRITFGFNCRNKDHYGIMMYHKNRLIKAYERVGCQLKVRKWGFQILWCLGKFPSNTDFKKEYGWKAKYWCMLYKLTFFLLYVAVKMVLNGLVLELFDTKIWIWAHLSAQKEGWNRGFVI